MASLNKILRASVSHHNHLCPRQVLGARIGLAGAQALDLQTSQCYKRLLAILETDGCFADGVEAATGCSVGHRTMRVEDYGKIAATFVDIRHGRAVRVAPLLDARERAATYAPGEPRHYFAQLTAYQLMPDAELLSIQEVVINTPIRALISRPGVRVNCDLCGEEIINEREVVHREMTLCQACARGAYYQTQTAHIEIPITVFDQTPVVNKQF
jgi:formylmethanofuran dehydrogenase subunit E